MMTALLLTVVATPAPDTDPARVATLIVLAFLGWRLLLIAVFPYAPHLPCKGTGKRFNGKNWRPCRGCRGTGRVLRLGRRIWNWSRRTRDDDVRRRR